MTHKLAASASPSRALRGDRRDRLPRSAPPTSAPRWDSARSRSSSRPAFADPAPLALDQAAASAAAGRRRRHLQVARGGAAQAGPSRRRARSASPRRSRARGRHGTRRPPAPARRAPVRNAWGVCAPQSASRSSVSAIVCASLPIPPRARCEPRLTVSATGAAAITPSASGVAARRPTIRVDQLAGDQRAGGVVDRRQRRARRCGEGQRRPTRPGSRRR